MQLLCSLGGDGCIAQRAAVSQLKGACLVAPTLTRGRRRTYTECRQTSKGLWPAKSGRDATDPAQSGGGRKSEMSASLSSSLRSR
jgi:hypothetical protein